MTPTPIPDEQTAGDWERGGVPQRVMQERPMVDIIDGSLLLIDVVGFTRLSERLARFGAAGTEQMISTVTSALTALTSAVEGFGGDVLLIAGDALLVLYDGDEHAARAHQAALAAKSALAKVSRVSTAAGPVILKVSQGIASGPISLIDVGDDLRALVPYGQTMVEVLSAQKIASAGEIIIAPAGPTRSARRRRASDDRLDPPPLDPGLYIPEPVRTQLPNIAYDHEHRVVDTAFVTYADLSHTPAVAARQISALVNSVQQACEAHGVTVTCVEPIGWGVRFMLTAGAPLAHENGADALLNTVFHLMTGTGAKPAVGMTRGLAFAGVMGGQHRWTWSAMGDCVNVAARLASKAEPGQVLIDDGALAAVQGHLDTRALPAAQVHSRRGAVRPNLVLGPPRPAVAAALTEFVGREAELEQLTRWLESPGDPRRIVSIQGVAGIGATSTAVRALAEHRRIELRARVDQRLVPFGSLQRELKRLFELPADARAASVDRHLTEWVSQRAPEVLDDLPLLRSALGVQSGTGGTEDQGRQQRLVSAVARLLTVSLGSDGVLFADRPSHLDASSQLVLRDLAANTRLGGPRILIAQRSQDPQPIQADWVLELEPLSTELSTAIAASILEQRHQPTSVAAELAERANGLPRTVIAFASNWSPAQTDIPSDVESLIAMQIDNLPGDLRRLTRYVSVMGDAVPRRLVREVLTDESDARLLDVARAFEDPNFLNRLSGLLEVTGGDQIRFVDPLVSQIAYRGLSFRRRRQLHARTGSLLELQEETHPAVLARHFLRGGNPAKAWRWAQRAGDSAFAAGAFNESADAYEIAIESAKSAGVDPDEVSRTAERWADSARMAGRFAEASQAYHLALSGAATGAWPRLLSKRAWVEGDLGHHQLALGLASRSIKAADGLPRQAARRAKAAAYVRRAGVRIRQGNFAAAEKELVTSLTFASAEGDEWSARAHLLLDAVLVDTGRAEAALTHRETALAMYTALGDWEGVGQVLNNYGIDAYWQGDLDAATDWYEQSLAAFDRAGDVVMMAAARNNLGEVASDLGDLERAEQEFGAFLVTAARAGNEQFEAHAYMNLAVVLVRKGRAAEALTLLQQAVSRFEGLGSEHFADQARVHRIEALIEAGELDRARSEFTALNSQREKRATLAPLHSTLDELGSRLAAV